MLEYLQKNSDLCIAITSISAVFISVLALILSVYMICVQIRHNKLIVKPSCIINFNCMGDHLALNLVNSGLGPMIIKHTEYKFKSEKVSELSPLLKDINVIFCTEGRIESESFSPSSQRVFFNVRFDRLEDLKNALEILKFVVIKVEYTDVYGNSFICTKDLGASCEGYWKIRGERKVSGFSLIDRVIKRCVH